MEAHGYTAPQPLPSNRHAWTAFVRVCQIRHYPMGQKHLPNWSDIESVLTAHGMWNGDIQQRLSVCFNELMAVEHEQGKASDG